MRTKRILPAVLMLAFLGLASACASVAPGHAHFGHPAAVTAASRTIALTPGMKPVQVHSGETVAFRAGSKTVGWTFSADHVQGTSVDMSEIFPDLPEARGVVVYIVPHRSRSYGR